MLVVCSKVIDNIPVPISRVTSHCVDYVMKMRTQEMKPSRQVGGTDALILSQLVNKSSGPRTLSETLTMIEVRSKQRRHP